MVNEKNIYIKDTSKVSVSDTLVLYIKDSFEWFNSLWNGKQENKGLNYYGFTIIKGESINKLIKIVSAWINLFEISTDEFILTGNYLLEEKKYEKNICDKEKVISELKALKALCDKAVKQKSAIMHEGI